MIYPIDMNGNVSDVAIKGKNVSLFFKRYIEMYLEHKIVIEISNIFNIVIIIIEFDITFLVLFPVLISLLIANWILKLAMDNSNEYVGIIKE